MEDRLDGSIALHLRTPLEWQRVLAARVRGARVELDWKQSTLARRAGVTLASLRRFEQRGEISLKHLMRILYALGRVDDLDAVLRPMPAATIAELERRSKRPTRQRGGR